MEWSYAIDLASELAYLLAVFGVFLILAVWRGRQAIINIIVGLYLGVFVTLEFPYTDLLAARLDSATMLAIAKLSLFTFITTLATIIVVRVMPDEFRENRLESLPKKLLLAAAATVLVMVFSFHGLPVTELLTPGTPIQSLFSPDQYFFWWLILPLAALYFAV